MRKKRGCSKRNVLTYRYKHFDSTKKNDTKFMSLFIVLMADIRKIAIKKGFNKKEFSGAFRRFNEVTGAYPFPPHLMTKYLKKF